MMLETFVPGWIAGLMGLACIITGVVLAVTAEEFAAWPTWGRTLLAVGIIVGSAISLLIWLKCFAVEFWQRSFTLKAEINTQAPLNAPEQGAEGVAITELRPGGRAEISGRRCDVRCEDGFAPSGSRLRVSGSEPGNLLVRLIA